MKLGIIGDSKYLIDDTESRWDIHSFVISPDTLSFFKIFHSAFSTPARYIGEIFVRLCTLEEKGVEPSQKFVFNPLFDVRRLVVMQVVAALRDTASFGGITILADKNGLPAGYLFPSSIKIKDAHFLTLLSTVDGEIDTELCRLLFQIEVQYIQLPRLALTQPYTNGFIYKENKSIYRWVTERAIQALRSQPAKSKDAIPFTAVMPHHAGDVLFFTLAFNGMHSHITRIAVNQAYQDIVRDNSPALTVLTIDAPVINRSEEFKRGKVTSEAAYFDTIQADLPSGSFYYYCRPSRDYNVTTFHLIDHFAFAIGRHFCSKDSLLTLNRPDFEQSPSRNFPASPRVLLHFDGGWSLKVYPESYQARLIDLLHAKGYVVTVLAGDPNMHAKCEVTTFKNYGHFKTLLENHDLLVGMDSFPAHYATHIKGFPTICLFASTRPENSNASLAPNYVFLEEGLRCRPCYGIVQCPLYGKSYCQNFVSPETVVLEVERMFEAVRKKDMALHKNQSSTIETGDCCLPLVYDRPTRVKRISLNYVDIKVFFGLVISPSFSYLFHLHKEYERALKTKGILFTHITVVHFIFRKIKSCLWKRER